MNIRQQDLQIVRALTRRHGFAPSMIAGKGQHDLSGLPDVDIVFDVDVASGTPLVI